jgi:hypothetical protein
MELCVYDADLAQRYYPSTKNGMNGRFVGYAVLHLDYFSHAPLLALAHIEQVHSLGEAAEVKLMRNADTLFGEGCFAHDAPREVLEQ